MTECDELIDRFHAQASGQIHLAVIAEATPVAEMHIDLAFFIKKQAEAVEKLCKDNDQCPNAVIQLCLLCNRDIVA